MMKQNNPLRRLLAALLAALTLVSFTILPVLGAAEDEAADTEAAETTEATAPKAEETEMEIISISTEDDLIALAASCTLDAWSREKHVVLEADLDLTGLTFSPIATFGGTFDGQGHTIRGLAITDALSPAGLICTLQPTGRVENLHIEGSVAPAGDPVSTGGLVGENYGTIENCSFTGTVSGGWATGGLVGENKASGVLRGCRTGGTVDGENRTGGLVGCNLGVIEDCENAAYVNIESVDPGIDLSDLDLSFSLDLTKLSELSTANIATDTGGVAGYNAGTISAARNTATIGYPHIGYNTGGIVGRTCGQLVDCVNTGAVNGRKDVGGVAGQVEPYIEMQLNDKTTKKLQTQLNELSDLVDKAASDAEGSAGGVASRLNTLSGYVDTAVEEAGSIRVNVDGKANVTGSGNVTGGASSSSTTTAMPGDTTASVTPGEGGSIDVTPKDDGGVTVDITTGSGSVTIDPGKLDVDHSGTASGGLDAVGRADAAAGLVAAPDLGGFTSAVNGVSSQINLLNDAVTGTVGTVSNDIKAINKKFHEISTTLFEAVNDAESGVKNAVTDASAVDVDQITLGKLSACRNEAAVSGDINTGGVAGSMALEYALDPEDDVSSDLDGSYKRQYTYRAVLQHCVNTGAITGKRSYVGGICGRMDLGLITACENYGPVESTSGSYVGGVTGLTGANVRESYAKCTLSGKSYVGGITGSGVAEALDGSGSTVAACVSLVDITGCGQYSGAISGAPDGTFTGNRFVSAALAGLDHQSIAGSAEPVDFQTLLEEDVLPEDMRTFTLKFVASGKTLKQLRFSYGDSFDESVFPAIPEQDGSYAAWDRTELNDLHFDTTVTAVYTSYVPGLASDAVREDGRAVLLAEGSYREGDSISASSEALTPSVFHVRTGNAANRIQAYFESVEAGKLPPMTANWDLIEQWSITVSSETPAPHRIRYLAPEGKTSRLRIYVEQGGVWQSVPFETVGSYAVFSIPAASARIAAVSTMPVWWIWAAIPLLLALIIFLMIHFIRKAVRKSKQKRAAQSAPQNAPLVPAGVSAVAAGSDPQPPAAVPADQNAELLARAKSAEEKLAELEAELAALKAQQAPENSSNFHDDSSAPEACSTEEANPKAEAAGTAAKPNRRFRWWIIPIAVIVIAAILAAVSFFGSSKLKTGLNAYELLKNYANQDVLVMQADAALTTNGDTSETSVDILRTSADGQSITRLARDGLSLYLANDTLYLADGSACALGANGLIDYGALLDMSVSLYGSAELETSKNGDETVYSAAISGEDAQKLAAILLPSMADEAGALREVSMSLAEQDGTLENLVFEIALSDEANTALSLTLTPRHGAAEDAEIPEAVLSAMQSGENTANITLTDDVFRLLRAWQATFGGDAVSADLRLKADCGPVVLDTTLGLGRQRIDGMTVTGIQKGPVTLYVSDGKILDSSGNAVDLGTNSWAKSANLLDAAAQLLFSATASHTEKPGGQEVYTIALDADGMAAAANAIAPDIESLDIDFTEGNLEIVLSGNDLSSITISCGGTLRLLLTDTDVSLSAVITPAGREFAVTQQVLSALQ